MADKPSPDTPEHKDAKAGADQACIHADVKADAAEANPTIPKTDDVERIAPLSGVDRSGLGDKGWAEVSEDRIGGHPELETPVPSGPDGDLNGPQPEMDPKTGAAKASN